VFCFDKTGTLTKDGLDFIGAQSLVTKNETNPSFGIVLSPKKGDNLDPLTVHGLATCHAVSTFGNQYVGNQVEVPWL
jgi:cation-transporting ATPase 13A3/4/5